LRKINFIQQTNAVSTLIFEEPTGRSLFQIRNQDGSEGWICNGCQWCIPKTPSEKIGLDDIKQAFEKHQCSDNRL